MEDAGLLIFEAESSPAQGDWGLENSIGGFSGTGYLRWNGTDAFNVSTAGRGTTTYNFRVSRAGNYELLWRSRITIGNNQTEHNDSWVRFPTGNNVPDEQPLNGWTKVFMSTLNSWAWQSATVDNVGRRVRQYFSAGDHTIQISGRSSGHAIDRIALFDYSDNSIRPSQFDSLSSSLTIDGSEGTGTGTNVTAPVLSVSGNQISWPAVNANSINVHRGNGDWIETLNASQTLWQAPAPGSYFLVATGDGSWQTWGRSNAVTVSDDANTGSPASSASIDLSGEVYSGTALELFWVADNAVRMEIRRNDQLVARISGQSYFDDSLSPGTQYIYSLTALDSQGVVAATESITLTTAVDPTSNANIPAVGGALNLRGEVYSQSAVELFWNSLQMDGAVSYEIFRGSDVQAIVDGRSLFIEGLSAGTGYDFVVNGLDATGATVASESIRLSTNPIDRL